MFDLSDSWRRNLMPLSLAALGSSGREAMLFTALSPFAWLSPPPMNEKGDLVTLSLTNTLVSPLDSCFSCFCVRAGVAGKKGDRGW